MKITLKAARVNRGLSQTEAAKLLGYNRVTLRRWENGEIIPKWYRLYELCSLYGVDREELELDPQKNMISGDHYGKAVKTEKAIR